MADRDDSHAQLIEQLAADLAPVRVKSQRRLFAQYALTLFLPGALFLAVLGFQPQISEQLAAFHFASSLLVVVAATAAGGLLLVRYSRPGKASSRWLAVSFFCTLLIAGLVQCIRLWVSTADATWGPVIHQGWECTASSLGMSAIVAGAILVELRHEAPVKLASAALFALLAASSLAALVLQFHCPNGHPLHHLLWHLLVPMLTLALLAAPAGRFSLRW